MAQNRRFSREFKLEAIRIWQDSDKTAAEVEDELGLRHHVLYEWKHHLLTRQADGGELSAQARVRQLERENWQLRQERDILKKAVELFTRPSKRDTS